MEYLSYVWFIIELIIEFLHIQKMNSEEILIDLSL